MILEFTQQFGHHKAGEIIEIPDGAVFDRSYLTEAPEGAEITVAAEEKPAADAKPLYPKKGA